MFYENFIKLCDARGIKPSPVLKQIGLSTGNLDKWKNGASVNSEALQKIALFFDVSIDHLLGMDNKINHEEKSLDEEKLRLINRVKNLNPDQVMKALEYIDFIQHREDN